MGIIRKLSLVLCLLCFATAVQSQDTTGFEWTPEQMVQLDEVDDPVISPDGKYVAYEIRETLMSETESSFRTHIWVMATDGSMNRQFTRGEKSASNPRFTPDGKALTFTSSRNGENNQVYRIYLNGGEAEQITHAENGVNSYKWSPDGSKIAYTMTDPQSEEEKKREKEKRDVVLVDKNYHFSRLYVETIHEDLDENTTKQIAAGDFQVTSFDWSPDGKTIVFSHQPTPKIDDGRESNISTVPSDSGAVELLVDWEGADTSPLFSKDGSFVVFQSSGGQEEPIGLSDIYRISAEGGTPTALAKTPNRSTGIVEWAPGGDNLLVSEVRKTYTALYQLPVDGSSPKLVTKEDGVYGNYDLSDNGKHLVFTFEQPSTPPNVYLSSYPNFSKKQLTDIYSDVEFPEMGKTELLTWTSKDGMEIEGLLTYPAGYEEGDKVPLILNVHGGPAGAYLQTWTGGGSIYPIQYFAAEGFAVLRPQCRGKHRIWQRFPLCQRAGLGFWRLPGLNDRR
ncbi:MAG: hypothetical protein U5J95_07075 [Balneolaceae bacterium]|nr:hypothetical protein [Balneolaceae bacterium]